MLVRPGHCFSPPKSHKYNTDILNKRENIWLLRQGPVLDSTYQLCWLETTVFVNFRWLDVSVANLTCTRYWVVYLQVIQEAVWPGGALPTAPRLERSQQQKDSTRQQALHGLMRLLPGACTHRRTGTTLSTKCHICPTESLILNYKMSRLVRLSVTVV